MGRKRTQLHLTGEELREGMRLLRGCRDPRVRERLRVAICAAQGEHTLEGLARLVGRSRATVQTWVEKYSAGGLQGLLNRDAPRGADSPLSLPNVKRDLVAGLKAGRWTSAASVAAWLKETHNIRRSRKSLYYWFQKLGISPSAAKPKVGRGPRQRRRSA